MAATPVWLASLEAMLNRYLAESQAAGLEARRLEGRSFAVEVASSFRLRAAVHRGRLVLSAGRQEEADAVISGTANALLNLLWERGEGASPASGAQVRGDAEVASRFRSLLKTLRPDLEWELARLIGELPARALAGAADTALGWGRRALARARENLAEYLQEESRDLVNPTELDEFLRGVDRVREAADRVEARLARLERRFGGAP